MFLRPLTFFFFFNDTATTEIYTLSLHDALPILGLPDAAGRPRAGAREAHPAVRPRARPHRSRQGEPMSAAAPLVQELVRSEEHTSELQSRLHLVCRLLLEKKKKKKQEATLQSLIE